MRTLLTILILLIGLAGCGEPEPSEPDAEHPFRIVALSPAAGDILWHMGLEESVVGRHNFEQLLDRSIPPTGDQSAIDYEQLIELRPTHVIVQTESQPIPDRLVEISESEGFEIINISTLALEDSLRTIRTLERAFEKDETLSERFESAIRQRPARHVGGVLVAMFTSPEVEVLGPGSAHQEIVERLGATPAIREGKPYLPLDAEDMVGLDPAIIFLIQPLSGQSASPPSARPPTREELGILDGLGLQAVDESRVFLIDHPQSLTSGASLIELIEVFERELYALPTLPSERDDHTDERDDESHKSAATRPG